VSPNGQLLSRRGRSLPADASGFDTHRDSISSRFDCRGLHRAAMGGVPPPPGCGGEDGQPCKGSGGGRRRKGRRERTQRRLHESASLPASADYEYESDGQ
jgi:hypothetical protein